MAEYNAELLCKVTKLISGSLRNFVFFLYSLLSYVQLAFSVCSAYLIFSENMYDKQSVYAYRECMGRVCMGLVSVITVL